MSDMSDPQQMPDFGMITQIYMPDAIFKTVVLG
jgi:hypothetical protein